jgi:hypothetical protein
MSVTLTMSNEFVCVVHEVNHGLLVWRTSCHLTAFLSIGIVHNTGFT